MSGFIVININDLQDGDLDQINDFLESYQIPTVNEVEILNKYRKKVVKGFELLQTSSKNYDGGCDLIREFLNGEF